MPDFSSDQVELRATIERALRQAMAGAMTVDVAIQIVCTAALSGEEALATTPAQRAAAESARLLARYDELGAGREAAGIVARTMSKDPQERERIAQRIRRLARERDNPRARRRKTNPVRLEG